MIRILLWYSAGLAVTWYAFYQVMRPGERTLELDALVVSRAAEKLIHHLLQEDAAARIAAVVDQATSR